MSSAIVSIYTPTLSVSRPNIRSPRKIYPKKLKKPNLNPQKLNKSPPFPPPPSPIGTEATTYTRLPPKDDFFFSSDPATLQSSSIVKLSDISSPLKIAVATPVSDTDLGLDYAQFDAFDDEDDSEEETNDGVVEVFEEFGFEDGEVVKFDGNGGVLEEGSEEEFDDEEDEVKEKGVPAVMRCFDRAKVFVKAGDGGNGVVAMRREKYVPLGGPSGGDGGRGGNVYVEVDGSMNSLLPFRNSIHFRAGRGSHGQGSKMAGAKGEDVVVKVAPGTVIREAVKDGYQGEVLLELLHPGQRALLLPGGRGGRGNASFKSGTNKVPRIAENGEEGSEM